MEQLIPTEPEEGQLTGSASGTATEASAGDAYATAIYEAIRQHWTTPTGLVTEAQLAHLVAAIKIRVADDGTILENKVIRSSGNNFFDDSCVTAIQATRKVPPPPANMRRLPPRIRAGIRRKGPEMKRGIRGLGGGRRAVAVRIGIVSVSVSVGVLNGGMAYGQAAPVSGGGDEDLPKIRITPSGGDLFRLALPRRSGDGDLTGGALEAETRDLDISGIFHLLDPDSFPADLQNEGLGFSRRCVASRRAGRRQDEDRPHRQRRGARGAALRHGPRRGPGDGANLPRHRGARCRPPVRQRRVGYFTGQPGSSARASRSRSAARPARRSISIDMDGSRSQVLTAMHSDCLLPAYSPGGGEVAFTSYLRNNPDLWVVSAGGGRARRISKHSGLNTGAAWSPTAAAWRSRCRTRATPRSTVSTPATAPS